MARQARTGDTVLVKSREMGGRSRILPWWLVGGGGGGHDDRNHNKLAPLIWPNPGVHFKGDLDPKWFIHEPTLFSVPNPDSTLDQEEKISYNILRKELF